MDDDEGIVEQVAGAALSIPRAWSATPPGRRLRALRRELRLSQRHLAEKSGVDQSVIGDLERGADGRWSTWNRLFEVFGYQAVPLPVTCSEESEEILRLERLERKDRMTFGREARWR
jgi:transcriptional regulator with XRE-family HTH domain